MGSTVTVRVGSQDPIDFFLKQDTDSDGLVDAPINLTGMSVQLRLQRASDQGVLLFAPTDVPQQLFIIDATQGHLQLRPFPSPWQTGNRHYRGYFVLTQGGVPIAVPEDAELTVIVREAF